MILKKWILFDIPPKLWDNRFMRKYTIDLDDSYIEVPEDLRKQIISDHLEKYYIVSLSTGLFIIGFLLGVLAYAL